MSLLDKLGISKDKRKVDPTRTMSYTQKQDFLKIQNKKRQAELDERTAKIGKVAPVERECPVCTLPMKVSLGQLMFCHKECKPRYKRALARSTK